VNWSRDVIVVGASMGGLEALSALVAGLPRDLPASVLVVKHVAATAPALLDEILQRRGPLPVSTATDGITLQYGRIYVAPPDRHLILTEAGVRVVFGPRENRSRPAIDPLFRTAAVNYRSRVIGVILSGLLGDGAAGLLAVHRCGGATVVQEPEDAAHDQMPLRALAAVPDAHLAPAAGLAPLLDRLAREPAPVPPPVPDALHLEARLTERAMNDADWHSVPGSPADFTCPDCGGALRRLEVDEMLRFRCRVGHAFTAEALAAAKGDGVEEALWLAMQTLQERADMLDSLSSEDEKRGWNGTASSYAGRARETRENAERLREFIRRLAI
jgi:two-component system, chemotaxis family, protein-glutamate methylesterase/glutaminase